MKLALAILVLALAGCGRREVEIPLSMRPVYVRVGYLHPARLPDTLYIHDPRIRIDQYAEDMAPVLDCFIVPRAVYLDLERRAGVKLWDRESKYP